jgi:hypothetical protein
LYVRENQEESTLVDMSIGWPERAKTDVAQEEKKGNKIVGGLAWLLDLDF